MTSSVVQAVKGFANSSTTVSTNSVDTPGSNLTIVVGISYRRTKNLAATPITDTYSNTFTMVGDPTDDGGYEATRIYICENAKGGHNHVVTANFTAAANEQNIAALFIRDTLLASCLDTFDEIIDTSAPLQTPLITTTQAKSMLIAMISGGGANPSTITTDSATPSTGWVIPAGSSDLDGASHWAMSFAHNNVIQTGSYRYGCTIVSSTTATFHILAVKDQSRTVLASDNFKRANAANLGSNWDIPSGDSAIPIATNIAHIAAYGLYGQKYIGGSITWPDDQWCRVVVGQIPDAADAGIGPSVRVNSNGNGILTQAGDTDTRVYVRVGGSYQQAGSTGSASAVGDVLYLAVEGQTVTFTRNGTHICGSPIDISSLSPPASGNPGLFCYTEGAVSQATYWEAGEFDAEEEPPPPAPETPSKRKYSSAFHPGVGPFNPQQFRAARGATTILPTESSRRIIIVS